MDGLRQIDPAQIGGAFRDGRAYKRPLSDQLDHGDARYCDPFAASRWERRTGCAAMLLSAATVIYFGAQLLRAFL